MIGDRSAIRALVREAVAPHAGAADEAGRLDDRTIRALAEARLFGANVAVEHGGAGADAATLVALHEEIGRACGSTRGVLTTHAMACFVVARFGGEPMRRRWLPALACGDAIGGFALTEDGAGSDAAAVSARATNDGPRVRLEGKKIWVTGGDRAHVFVVIAQAAGGPTAYLVPRERVQVVPMAPAIGLRAAGVSALLLDGCVLEGGARLGAEGGGVSFVAGAALELGRLLVAAGCVGAMASCAELALAHARSRRQGGAAIGEHQLVQRRLTRMIAYTRAARAIVERAAAARQARHPDAARDAMLAKYVASSWAAEVTADAVQVLGASGLASGAAAQRHLRDATVAQIIEGSTEICETTLARAWLGDPAPDV